MWRELQPDDPGRIGPYRLRGVLGSGGMGRVFLGASADGRLAAVKVIRADLATDLEFRARFRREVTVARKVSSRFTVPLIDADTGSASDIFSLGAVLAFAATGQAPFGSGSAPTLAYRAVYREVNLDRVPAEVRPLIQRCLAKDAGQRPTARELEFGAAAAVPPTERWLPAAVTRTFIEPTDDQAPSRTVTSARLSPASPLTPGHPGRHRDRRQRRLARPLTIASPVVGLLAASAAGGLALTASAHQMPGAHSGQAVSGRVTSPATSAPATSAPSTAPAANTAPSMSASATAPASATPTATPTAVVSPTASPSGTPAVSSSPAPSASPSGSVSPTPSGSVTPTPSAS